jgi:hypothetical protein
VSAGRKHTLVPELGWVDWLTLCREDAYVRVEGHDNAATAAAGRLVRFNRQVAVLPSTANGLTVHAEILKRTGERMDLLIPSGRTIELNWHELDWVSWEPHRSASGRRFKVTTEGASSFGEYELWNDCRVVHLHTRQVWDYGNRSEAMVAVLKMINKRGV